MNDERDLMTSPQPPASLTAKADVLEALQAARFSCRGYLADSVPHETIARMLRMAQKAPSWCNSQPWETIVTEGEGTERVRDALFARAQADQVGGSGMHEMAPDMTFPENYTGVYKERQRAVGWQLYESVGVAFGDRVGSGRQTLENFRFFGAPHMLLVTSERSLGIYGAVDCGVYMGNLQLAAQSLGLGMVLQAALAAYAPLMRDIFAIPDNRIIVAGASFGYPDLDHPANSFRSARASIEEVVYWISK